MIWRSVRVALAAAMWGWCGQPPHATQAQASAASQEQITPAPRSAPTTQQLAPAVPAGVRAPTAEAPPGDASQEQQRAPTTVAPPEQAGAPENSPDARRTDAQVDRLVVSSTAETHPAGTFFFSSYEVVLLQFGYALTDTLQVSMTGFVEPESLDHIAELTFKGVLHRSLRWRVAALTSIDHVRGGTDDRLLFGRIGLTSTYCFLPGCQSSMSLSGTVFVHDRAAIVLPLGLGGGFTVRIAPRVALLFEYTGVMTLVEDLADLLGSALPLWTVNYGVRFSGASWGVDIALLRTLRYRQQLGQTSTQQLRQLFGVPFVVFTYRWHTEPPSP